MALGERFRAFAAVECGRSPLYRALAEGIAGDADLLALAGASAPGQPAPNLFLAAVRDLALAGVGDPYGSFAAFRAFCLAQAEPIRQRLRTRRVQTNEVARCACLLPAFARVADAVGGAPLALVDVGASAGLHLFLDRYAYEYSDGRRWGPAGSPVHLTCEVRGGSPPLPPGVQVALRVGIDLHPVDVRDPGEARWLLALVWPDQPERAARLQAAMRLAAADPPRVVAGDAFDVLPTLAGATPAGDHLCVFHCHTLNQFAADDRVRFGDMLAGLGRPVSRVAIEWSAGEPGPRLTLTRYPAATEERLGHCDGHGEWLHWSA